MKIPYFLHFFQGTDPVFDQIQQFHSFLASFDLDASFDTHIAYIISN